MRARGRVRARGDDDAAAERGYSQVYGPGGEEERFGPEGDAGQAGQDRGEHLGAVEAAEDGRVAEQKTVAGHDFSHERRPDRGYDSKQNGDEQPHGVYPQQAGAVSHIGHQEGCSHRCCPEHFRPSVAIHSHAVKGSEQPGYEGEGCENTHIERAVSSVVDVDGHQEKNEFIAEG